MEVFVIKDQFKDFEKRDFEKTTKIKNVSKTQFFSLLGGVIPVKTPTSGNGFCPEGQG